jgi:hypothetical protein
VISEGLRVSIATEDFAPIGAAGARRLCRSVVLGALASVGFVSVAFAAATLVSGMLAPELLVRELLVRELLVRGLSLSG